jgi:RPA family protein
MAERELAWRVFAGEYNATNVQLEASQEREPGYLVTPLGAKINRIFVVGVLTDVEKLEKNGNTHYRARVSDRTGVFFIYAGQYDPEVIKVLSTLEPPKYIAVIGKSRMYSPNEGTNYVSIRPEKIAVVDKNVRDSWLLDASKNLKLRLEAINEASQMEPPEIDKLVKLGFEHSIAEGVVESMKHYSDVNIVQYKTMLVEVLKYLVTDDGGSYIASENTESEEVAELNTDFKTGDELTNDKGPDESEDLEFEVSEESGAEVNEEDIQKQADQLFDIIATFKGKKYTHGVPWNELVEEATDKGIDKNAIEDLVNNLLDKGKIYEPMLGKIKCTN